MASQRDRILHLLIDAHPDGICGTTFLKALMPRYGARICELRADGWDIRSEPCLTRGHETRQTTYRLANVNRLISVDDSGQSRWVT